MANGIKMKDYQWNFHEAIKNLVEFVNGGLTGCRFFHRCDGASGNTCGWQRAWRTERKRWKWRYKMILMCHIIPFVEHFGLLLDFLFHLAFCSFFFLLSPPCWSGLSFPHVHLAFLPRLIFSSKWGGFCHPFEPKPSPYTSCWADDNGQSLGGWIWWWEAEQEKKIGDWLRWK